MTTANQELFDKLDEVQKAYEATLQISALAAFASSRSAPAEPTRNVFYPLTFAVDKDAFSGMLE